MTIITKTPPNDNKFEFIGFETGVSFSSPQNASVTIKAYKNTIFSTEPYEANVTVPLEPFITKTEEIIEPMQFRITIERIK